MRKRELGSWGYLCGETMWNVLVKQSTESMAGGMDGWMDRKTREKKWSRNTCWGRDKRWGSTREPRKNLPGFLLPFQFQIPEDSWTILAPRFHETPRPVSLELYFHFSLFCMTLVKLLSVTCYRENFNWNTHQFLRGGKFPYKSGITTPITTVIRWGLNQKQSAP